MFLYDYGQLHFRKSEHPAGGTEEIQQEDLFNREVHGAVSQPRGLACE